MRRQRTAGAAATGGGRGLGLRAAGQEEGRSEARRRSVRLVSTRLCTVATDISNESDGARASERELGSRERVRETGLDRLGLGSKRAWID